MANTATTEFVPSSCAQVEVKTTEAGNWIDITGESQAVSGTEQTRLSGEAYVFAGDKAIVTSGSREPMELTFDIVYTEVDPLPESQAEAYELVKDVFQDTSGCGAKLWVRYSPKGGNAGDERIEADGYLTSFTFPEVDASSGDPIMSSFSLTVSEVSTVVVAS